jgi:tetratricopeptide (TPR) repeat protein
MHMSWRTYAMILLIGIWPHLGCHQVPGDKSVQDLRPIQQTAGSAKKQELTAADITQSWIAKADKLEKDGKTSEAIALCEKMREPGNPQALQATKKLALIYDRNHDLDRAEQEYQRILQQNPQDADTLCNLGYLSYRRSHWYIAEKYLRSALAQKPDHAYAWVNLGMTLAQQGGRDAESLEAFAKVLPKAEAYCEVAFILKLQGKLRDAIRAYETALTIEPAMPRANAELAKMRLTDAASTVTLTTPYGPGQKGAVELEEAPVRWYEGTGRLMMQRPTLPPLPDLDLPPSNGPTTGTKK